MELDGLLLGIVCQCCENVCVIFKMVLVWKWIVEMDVDNLGNKTLFHKV